MSVHFFVIAGDFWYASVLVDNGNACFAGVMQAFLGVLYAGGCGTGTGRPRQHHQGKGGLPRHVLPYGPQVSGNGLEPVGDMPMSLLAYTSWTSPNVWTRTAPCSATLSATPSSLASEVPAKQVWRWSVPARQHGIAASAVPLIPQE